MTAVMLSRKEAKQVIRTHDLLVAWVREHEELCEERMKLLALGRSIRAAGKVYDRIEKEVTR